MSYKLIIPPHVASLLMILPPDLKKVVRRALDDLAEDPRLGIPLERELKGLWKYTVRRYRIIYKISASAKAIDIYAFGHRATIYEELSKA